MKELHVAPLTSVLDIAHGLLADGVGVSKIVGPLLCRPRPNLPRQICVQFRALSAPDVLGGRHGFHVVGVDACPVPAEMIKNQAARNRPSQQNPHHAVGGHALPAQTSVAVPGAAQRSLPHPTPRGGVNGKPQHRNVEPPAMTEDITNGLPCHVSLPAIGGPRDGCGLTTTTQTQPGRVRTLSGIFLVRHLLSPPTTREGCHAPGGCRRAGVFLCPLIVPRFGFLERFYQLQEAV